MARKITRESRNRIYERIWRALLEGNKELFFELFNSFWNLQHRGSYRAPQEINEELTSLFSEATEGMNLRTWFTDSTVVDYREIELLIEESEWMENYLENMRDWTFHSLLNKGVFGLLCVAITLGRTEIVAFLVEADPNMIHPDHLSDEDFQFIVESLQMAYYMRYRGNSDIINIFSAEEQKRREQNDAHFLLNHLRNNYNKNDEKIDKSTASKNSNKSNISFNSFCLNF